MNSPVHASGPEDAIDTEALFRAHAAFVATCLVRLGVGGQDVEDLVQEVFLVAHRRGFVTGPAQPTTWLAEIAVRVAANSRRGARRRGGPAPGVEIETLPASQPNPFESAAASEALQRLQAALDALPLDLRTVFFLYEVQGDPCDAIAAATGVPVGTVYSRLHAARRELERVYARVQVAAPPPAARAAATGAVR